MPYQFNFHLFIIYYFPDICYYFYFLMFGITLFENIFKINRLENLFLEIRRFIYIFRIIASYYLYQTSQILLFSLLSDFSDPQQK